MGLDEMLQSSRPDHIFEISREPGSGLETALELRVVESGIAYEVGKQGKRTQRQVGW